MPNIHRDLIVFFGHFVPLEIEKTPVSCLLVASKAQGCLMPEHNNTANEPAEAQPSVILSKLVEDAPPGHFTMAWLLGYLPQRSFGFIILFLALVSLLPFISIPASILILILTFQVIIGYQGPVLPQRLMDRQLPSRYLARLERFAIPALRHLEKIVRPRWPEFLRLVRPFAALVAMLLALLLLLSPIPFSNLPPAMICAVMALAYIEHDGLLLCIALTVAVSLLGAALWAIF
jgi:hypothetical protein